MGAEVAAGVAKDVHLVGNDPIEQVRKFIARNGDGGDQVFVSTGSIEEDLVDLISRVEKVRSMAGRFSDVELSPFVKRMVELADKHRLTV